MIGMHPSKLRLMNIPLLTRLVQSIREYCTDIKQMDNELWFTFNSVRMHLSADAFTMNATIVAEVFDFDDHENEVSSEELYAVEKARVIDPFGHAGFDPSGKIRLTP